MLQPLKILQASAGSGKTFSLTAHYLTLLLSGETKYREILAVTFTNKATEEMKSRIMEVLKGFATGNEGVKDYRELVLKAHPDLNPKTLQEKSERIYKRILHDYSRFSVSTIDGFVQKVIRGFAFELGLDSGYALEMNFEKVKNDLADRLDQQLDHNPNLLQWIIDLALDRISNNISWNYRTELTDLAGEIFKERYQPFDTAIQDLVQHNDLNELFKNYGKETKKHISSFENMVSELSARATELFDSSGINHDQLKGKSKSPLHNLKKIAAGEMGKMDSLNKLIDEPEEWFKPGSDMSLYDSLNPIIRELNTGYLERLPEYILAQAFNKNLYYLRLMQEMAVLLKAYREESGNLLISDAQNLLKGITGDDDDNPAFIWEKTGSRYRHFLFDEFQDTSSNQWGNFKPLLKNAMAEANGKLIDHLIVGDVKQSIYRWRNGDWNILHQQAKQDIGVTYVTDASLEENYRSTKNIISFNNFLFRALPLLMQRNINDTISSQTSVAELQPWWEEKGFDQIMTSVYAEAEQKTTARTPEGGAIDFQVLKTNADGAPLKSTDFKSEALRKMVETLKRLLVEEKRYRAGDACVLVRSNAEAIAVVDALMENHISVISGEALLIENDLAVILLIDTLKVMAGLTENTALYKANCISLYAQLQNRVLDPVDLFNLKNKTLEELTEVLPPDLCQHWRSWMQQPLPELLEKLMAAYGLNTAEIHLPYLFALRDLTGNIGKQGEKGITSFLKYWNEEGSRKTLPSSESTDAVQVITIHKSKGLAFKVVMIPFCNWDINGKINSIFWVPAANTPYHQLGRIPLKYSSNLGASSVAIPYYEELLYNQMDALNMLYVATTRTKEYLYISTLGKKSEGTSTIGDLLIRVLEDDISEDGRFFQDDEVIKKVQDTAEETIKPELINLKEYPVSDRLTAVFNTDLKRRELDMLGTVSPGREGSILHEVLARASDPEEVDHVLAEMLNEGYFREEELSSLQQQATTVLSHADLQRLLNSSTQTVNEKSIIDRDGKSYRPDKVLISDTEVVVIDYKFTQKESPAHIKQVHGYRALLQEMGYPSVSTYLFYANSGELKLV
ncbi:ATP-dependent exoDNAse (exonuclease V) beta subunit (contains helicase and exonuclease domains) [Pedobacter westerhofensis]|uniref:DNA 3'-5' helicase n=1 Tax=Pedobacter westerhofensis TaxID=425512 RepID=A0A521DZD0_9SPHI|nr:UvrD-helicase domain-containing protein [Pedobacter westerhofensis]SMO76975.1 ATP-dependent exoDNAse (exonuclease V) beta subunit (contains helicase and exonuclease domains) [Pedobacter westerhofensis]